MEGTLYCSAWGLLFEKYARRNGLRHKQFGNIDLIYQLRRGLVKMPQCLIIFLAEKRRLPRNKIEPKSGRWGLAGLLTGGVFSVYLFTVQAQEAFDRLVQPAV